MEKLKDQSAILSCLQPLTDPKNLNWIPSTISLSLSPLDARSKIPKDSMSSTQPPSAMILSGKESTMTNCQWGPIVCSITISNVPLKKELFSVEKRQKWCLITIRRQWARMSPIGYLK